MKLRLRKKRLPKPAQRFTITFVEPGTRSVSSFLQEWIAALPQLPAELKHDRRPSTTKVVVPELARLMAGVNGTTSQDLTFPVKVSFDYDAYAKQEG